MDTVQTIFKVDARLFFNTFSPIQFYNINFSITSMGTENTSYFQLNIIKKLHVPIKSRMTSMLRCLKQVSYLRFKKR